MKSLYLLVNFFTIIIPFSFVFTYYCFNKFFDLSWNPRNEAVACL